jgi:transposase-like protein
MGWRCAVCSIERFAGNVWPNILARIKGRHFQDEIIVLCVRWYLRFSLTYRDLEELMTERNLSVDHTTVWRWLQRYAPELNKRIRREVKPTNGSWRTDETYVRVAGRWAYLYRAVDSMGATIDFLLSETRNLEAVGASSRRLWPRLVILDRVSSRWMEILPIQPSFRN